MKKPLRVVKFLFLITVFVVVVGYFLAGVRVPYNDVMVIEAGDKLFSAAYFFKAPHDKARYITDVDKLDIRHVGEYPICIKLNGLKYNVKLKVVDTVKPVVEGEGAVDCYLGNVLSPRAFIKSVDDVTDCVFEYLVSPDFFKLGKQRVVVAVRDEGGNEVIVESVANVVEDTEPPHIYGLHDLYVHLGDTIMYRDMIKVFDNMEGASMSVDTSRVNEAFIGDYEVIYSATDLAGNETKQSVTLHILEPLYKTVSDDEILAAFEKEYGKIIKDDMSEKEKASAIFDRLSGILEYIPVTDKASYTQNAYSGLITGKGDCVTYYSMYKILLDMAEIENMKVVTKNEDHTFNMIKIDGEWYFSDTFYGNRENFMMKKEDLPKYIEKGCNFNIDYDNYPD